MSNHPRRNRSSSRKDRRRNTVHHIDPLELLESPPVAGSPLVVLDAPEIFRRLVSLPLVKQLERLDEYLSELGPYRTASGALDLQPKDRHRLQKLLDRRHACDDEVMSLGIGDVTGPSLLLTLPQMVRLYRFLANHDYSAAMDRMRRSTLTSIARNIAAARYFKMFDEQLQE